MYQHADLHHLSVVFPMAVIRSSRRAVVPFAIAALLFSATLSSSAYAQYSPGTVSPDANNTTIVNLINRFRADPRGELGRLLDNPTWSSSITASSDAEANDGTTWSDNFWGNLSGGSGASSNIAGAMDFFEVSPGDLLYQWNNLPDSGTLHPYTWNGNLGHSADLYNDDLVADNGMTPNPHRVGYYDSDNSGDPDYWVNRFPDAGYTGWSTLAENLFRQYTTANGLEYSHAGFAVDWGGDNPIGSGNGIQGPPGHRNSMLSLAFTEIGVDVQDSMMPGNSTQTQHFGNRFANRFLWGYVYDDIPANGYDFDDALSNVTVQILDDSMSVVGTGTTNDFGGYAIDIAELANGNTYTVDFLQAGNSIGTGSFTMDADTLREASFAVLIPEPATILLAIFALLVAARRRPTWRSPWNG